MSTEFIDTYSSRPIERFDEIQDASTFNSRSSASSSSRNQSSSTNRNDEEKNDIIIEAHNIHKTYLLGIEGVPALRGVNLNIHRGEFIVILGTSGGGKTSLLNIIGTIDKPTKGEINICGQRITNRTTDAEFAQLRLSKIGFVFQTFNLIPSMSALENVSLPMVLAGKLNRSEIKERAIALLERVGLGSRVTHLPSQLSGGEQQRVTIARSIANRPELLLLDEPTGDLDTVNSIIILNLLLQLNRHENITCVMVTHDQSLKWYAHRVIHMVDGKVLRIETIPEQARLKADHELQIRVDGILSEREHGHRGTELFDQEQGRHGNTGNATQQNHEVQFTDFREPLQSYSYLNSQRS